MVVVAAVEKQGKTGTSETGEVRRFAWGLAGDHIRPWTTSRDLGLCGPSPHGDSSRQGRAAWIHMPFFFIGKEEEGRSTAAGAGKFVSFAAKGILFLIVGFWLVRRKEGRERR